LKHKTQEKQGCLPEKNFPVNGLFLLLFFKKMALPIIGSVLE